MPKTDRPLYGDSATGEIAGILGFKKGIPFTSPGDEDEIPYGRIEKKRVAAVSRSPGQAAVRDAYLSAKNQWLFLTDEQKQVYNDGAPSGWTGFNYFLFIELRAAGLWFGELVFYEDLFKQGNVSGVVQSADYQNNFPGSADVIPTFTDGVDNFQAWLFNKLVASILQIEYYILIHKNSIEEG